LVFWILDAVTACPKIERIFVATDNEEIANVIRGYGSAKAEVIGRTAATATDTARAELAVLEFAACHDFENIALIQATSPLLQPEHLEKGFQRLAEDGIDSVLSVVRQKRFIWENKQNNLITPYNYDPFNRPCRQNFEGFLVENGAFYITSKNLLVKNKCRLSGNISYVEMPEDTYFEIDELSDWIIVEALMKKGCN
jgi:CMP-N-acetylneuraminic acid synthetase